MEAMDMLEMEELESLLLGLGPRVSYIVKLDSDRRFRAAF